MRKSVSGIIVLIIVLLLSACGSSANGGSNEGASAGNGAVQSAEPSTEAATPSEAAPAPEAANAAYPRDIASAGGPVTIAKQPLKVGLAFWGFIEMLFPFDLPSAGITVPFAAAKSSLESDAYKPYADKFDELKIVGENTQVNLEAMLAYQPDVIVAGSKSNAEIKEQLEQIAPTVWVDEEKINIRTDWPEVVTLIGSIVGQEDRAQEVIDNIATKQSEGKQALAARSGESVIFVQVREKAVYVMSTASLPQYYEGLGLTPPDGDMSAISQITLEGLSQLNPDHIFLGYFNWTDKSLPALTDEWQKSEVWKSLKAVKNNHVYPINGEIALGIGPIGEAYGIDTVVDALK